MLKEDNSDLITIYPELNCASSPRPRVCDRDLFKYINSSLNKPSEALWLSG